MLKNIVLILILSISNFAFCQDIKMTTEYGSQNEELIHILYFEDIIIERINFEGEKIVGKSYEINIKEYYKGKLLSTKNLVRNIKIDSSFLSIKFYSKFENKTLKTYIRGKGFGSRKDIFKLRKPNLDYTLKSLQGNIDFIEVPLNQEFPVLAIITPTIHKDGSGSYCEVAQSDVTPEKFGEKFKIPHYFIITMRFK